MFRGDIGFVQLAAVLIKSLDFAILLGKGTDNPHTGKAVADRGGEAALQMPGASPHVHHAIPGEF